MTTLSRSLSNSYVPQLIDRPLPMRHRNLAIIGAALVSQLPLLIAHFRRLWSNEQYGFFPFILLVFAWLVYSRWPDASEPLRPLHRALGLCLLFAGWLFFAASVMMWSPWLAAVGVIFTTGFLLVHVAGNDALRSLGPAWLLLWLLIPLPFNLDQELVSGLQSWSSRLASSWLDWAGLNHVLTGHVIHVPAKRFVIEEACSGSHSLYVIVTLAAVLAVVMRYNVLRAGLLLLAAACWAMVGNSLRIMALVGLHSRWGLDLSDGIGHTLLGLLTVSVTMALLVSTDRGLSFLFSRPAPPPQIAPPESDEDASAVNISDSNESNEIDESRMHSPASAQPAVLNPRWSWVAVTVFAMIGSAQLIPFVGGLGAKETAIADVKTTGLRVESNAISSVPAGWTFLGFDRVERDRQIGGHSSSWTYKREDVTARLSLDFPFEGWHELSVCYTHLGWELANRRVTAATNNNQAQPETAEIDLQNPRGQFGFLLVSLFDADGNWASPPASPWEYCRDAIHHRLTRRGVGQADARSTFQYQVFVSSSSPFTVEERQHVAELYFSSRDQVMRRLKSMTSQKRLD